MHLLDAVGNQIGHARNAVRVMQGHIQNGMQALAHGIKRISHAARFRFQHVRQRRLLLGMLGRSEAGTFGKNHDRHRLAEEFLTGLAGGGNVLSSQLRTLLQLRFGVTLHEREIQRPPGQPQHRHPEQFFLQEKAHERNAFVEHLLQHQDIDPALMVGQHQIMAIGRKRTVFAIMHLHGGHMIHHPAVETDPGFCQADDPAIQQDLQRFDRQQSLKQRAQQKQRHPDHGIGDDQQVNQRNAQQQRNSDKHGRP